MKKTIFILLIIFTSLVAQDDFEQWLKEQDASLSGAANEEAAALAAISKSLKTMPQNRKNYSRISRMM